MLFHKICGVDLGTDTIKICDKSEKLYVCEKNMLAIRNKKDIIAVGGSAADIYERNPSNVEMVCPMQGGAIADVQNLGFVLNRLLRRYTGVIYGYPDIIITIPAGINELERMAMRQLLTSGIRPKRVALIENGLADGAGIGMPLLHPMGNMVVNIGASTTNISVISEGKIIVGKRLKMGGYQMDEDIISVVRRRYDLNIGHRTAEMLKKNLAYVLQGTARQMKVFGIHAVTGLPDFAVVTSGDVNDAIGASLYELAEAVRAILERTPPQLARDIRTNGVYITGGVSVIPHLSEYFGQHLETVTYTVPDPVTSTVRGLVRILGDPNLKKLAFSPKEL